MRGYYADETAHNFLFISTVMDPPKAILSSQGCNLMSKVLSFIYNEYAIQRIKISTYLPAFNEKLTRFKSSLKHLTANLKGLLPL